MERRRWIRTVAIAQAVHVATFMWVVLAAWCVALSIFDVRYRRLPNWLTIPGFVVITFVAAIRGEVRAVLVGAVALAACYLVVHVLRPGSLGAGDVKLALGVGGAAAFGGAHAWVLAAVMAPVLSVGIALVTAERASIPHGASMSAACLGALVWTAF